MAQEIEKLLFELIRNASLSRYRHFFEANRHSYLNCWIGGPVVLINIALGSTFFALIDKDIPEIAKWAAAGFALCAALLSGIQTFFNFSKMFEGHRKLGNRYLEIVRELEKINAYFKDGVINDDEFHKEIDSIYSRYLELNEDSSGFSTSKKSMAHALEQEKLRMESLNERAPNEQG